MKQLTRILVILLVGLVLSLGVTAQKGNNSNRPPKEKPRIVEKEKPPPKNTNRGRPD